MLQQCDRTKRHPETWQAAPLAKLSEGGDSAAQHSKPCHGRCGCSVCLHDRLPVLEMTGRKSCILWMAEGHPDAFSSTKVGEGIHLGLTS